MNCPGSTGTPKGVVITHANVVHFVRWAVRYFGIGPEDRISGHPPLHFDLSTNNCHGPHSLAMTAIGLIAAYRAGGPDSLSNSAR